MLKYLDEIEFKDTSRGTSEKSTIHVVDRIISNFAELINLRAFANQIVRQLDDHGLILKDIDP